MPSLPAAASPVPAKEEEAGAQASGPGASESALANEGRRGGNLVGGESLRPLGAARHPFARCKGCTL